MALFLLVCVRGGVAAPDLPGYWVATASEDWCEPNYQYSIYIAEYWNTLSSLPMVVLSLFSLYAGLRQGHSRSLLVGSALTALVGLGSIWFHGTLHYGGQALDELCMVLAATLYLYAGLECDPRGVRNPLLAPLLTAWSAAFVTAYVLLKDTSYFLFFVFVFILLSLRCCYGAYLLHQRTANKTLRVLYFAGQGLWAAGFILFWFPDKMLVGLWCQCRPSPLPPAMPHAASHTALSPRNNTPFPPPPIIISNRFCPHVQAFNLHAIFHLMSAVAVFWFHTHNVHCYYVASYALKTGGLVPAEEGGGTTPAPPALMEFLELSVAPEPTAGKPPERTSKKSTAQRGQAAPPAHHDSLRRPTLSYLGGVVGPFCELVEERKVA